MAGRLFDLVYVRGQKFPSPSPRHKQQPIKAPSSPEPPSAPNYFPAAQEHTGWRCWLGARRSGAPLFVSLSGLPCPAYQYQGSDNDTDDQTCDDRLEALLSPRVSSDEGGVVEDDGAAKLVLPLLLFQSQIHEAIGHVISR
ncbi:MAG: hypothetical protein LQ341_004437 [Variospora aurantia]|nr:MAG: hypothetical protein LQ341_004437 [Variospora aurantia]